LVRKWFSGEPELNLNVTGAECPSEGKMQLNASAAKRPAAKALVFIVMPPFF
jgi:hypothetical protein